MHRRGTPDIVRGNACPPIGYDRKGRPVYPIMGGAGTLLAGKPAAAPTGGPAKGGARIPFARASYYYTEKIRTDSWTTAASQQTAAPIPITPGGFLQGVWVEVIGTGGALGTAVLGSPTDFPYALISSVTIEDVNGGSICGPISGYELYLANKYGGYFDIGDPTLMPGFNGTFASPYFIVFVPLQIRSDGLGSLANTDARAQYRMLYTVENEANFLSTGTVTTHISLTVTTWVAYWGQVEPTDLRGIPQEQVPPGVRVGTTQFWAHEFPPIAVGAQTVKHNRVGNAIRTIVYTPRTGSAASSSQPANQRADAFTDPVKIRLDNRYLMSESPRLRQNGIMAREYGLGGGAHGDPATIGTPSISISETGVYVYSRAHDLSRHPSPGDESNWLETNEAQLLQLETSMTGTVATLGILTNDIALRGDVPMPTEIA